MEAQAKPTYIGLWVKNDKNGNPFLSGSTESTVYFVFTDKDGSKSLHTIDKTVEGAKIKKGGSFTVGESDKGPYYKLDNMTIFENNRREKETHPHYNLVVYPS
jgi:hypothetical protein